MIELISHEVTKKGNLIKFLIKYKGKDLIGFVPVVLYDKLKKILKDFLPNIGLEEIFFLNTYLGLFEIEPDRENNLWMPDFGDAYMEYLFDGPVKEKVLYESKDTSSDV